MMSKSWKDRPEAGTQSALTLMVWLAHALGRRWLQLVIFLVSTYFFLARSEERRASRNFLSKALGRPASLVDIYRHFFNFAKVTSDRVFFLSGTIADIQVEIHGAKKLTELQQRTQGGIFLAAHMGSFEAGRIIAEEHFGLDIRMALDRAVNERFTKTLEKYNPGLSESIIDLNQSESNLGLAIYEAIQHGSWVGFLADRHMPGDRTASCDFMGCKARIPTGPFIVAAALHVPVVCVFPLYINGRYEIYQEILAEDIQLPRKEREAGLQKLAQEYANRLEHYATLAPYNWFNFYDFWEPNE
jgi:predicted LPLAT superfamily acyltransferase